MFCRFFVLLFVTATFFGCGAEEKIILGEEVVVEKWIDPIDVGKEYLLEAEVPKVGDTVFLSTGEHHTVEESSFIDLKERGTFISTLTNFRPNPKNPGTFLYSEKIPRGYVVPEGPPIVSLYSDALFYQEGIPITIGLTQVSSE